MVGWWTWTWNGIDLLVVAWIALMILQLAWFAGATRKPTPKQSDYETQSTEEHF